MNESERQAPAGDGDDPAAGTIELLSGLFFAGIGCLALFLGRNYPTGSALDMGPGYLPRLIAVLLVGVGLIGIVRGLLSRRRAWPAIAMRPVLWIGAAILVFAALIERAGLFIACLVAVLVAAAAEAGARWREAPVVAFLLAGSCVLLFGYALRLAIPMWPR